MNVTDLMRAAVEAFGIPRPSLFGRNKGRAYCLPRQVFYYVACHYYGRGYSELGWKLGFDHTTVLHGRQVIAREVAKRNPKVRGLVAAMLRAARRRRDTLTEAARWQAEIMATLPEPEPARFEAIVYELPHRPSAPPVRRAIRPLPLATKLEPAFIPDPDPARLRGRRA